MKNQDAGCKRCLNLGNVQFKLGESIVCAPHSRCGAEKKRKKRGKKISLYTEELGRGLWIWFPKNLCLQWSWIDMRRHQTCAPLRGSVKERLGPGITLHLRRRNEHDSTVDTTHKAASEFGKKKSQQHGPVDPPCTPKYLGMQKTITVATLTGMYICVYMYL